MYLNAWVAHDEALTSGETVTIGAAPVTDWDLKKDVARLTGAKFSAETVGSEATEHIDRDQTFGAQSSRFRSGTNLKRLNKCIKRLKKTYKETWRPFGCGTGRKRQQCIQDLIFRSWIIHKRKPFDQET